ncbi:hypothetical protein [Roseococcus sp.]|uniref:hypothetical protein n=1 Tax=Roseococcus sp. TaxID=2109646 RepID=UPI003BAC8EB0
MPDGHFVSRELLTAPLVAKALGRSLTWFYHHRVELEEQHGFPRTVRGCGTRWDPRAIEAWRDAQLPAAPSAEGETEQLLLRRAATGVR